MTTGDLNELCDRVEQLRARVHAPDRQIPTDAHELLRAEGALFRAQMAEHEARNEGDPVTTDDYAPPDSKGPMRPTPAAGHREPTSSDWEELLAKLDRANKILKDIRDVRLEKTRSRSGNQPRR